MSLFFQKLYVRIWLAVVLAVAVLTLLVGWAWRMTAEPPLREVVVRNAMGEIIGNGQVRMGRGPEGSSWHATERPRRDVAPPPGSAVDAEPGPEEGQEIALHGKYGNGPVLTSEACLLNPNRNPSLKREDTGVNVLEMLKSYQHKTGVK